MIIVKILALMGAWLFFYNLLKARHKRLPGTKATLVTLIFASLLFHLISDLYAMINRTFFSINAQGQVALNESPLKIPSNQDTDYCKQFTDQNHQPLEITITTEGRYCGEFWRFKYEKNIMLPYRILNTNQIMYWASPKLQIIGPHLVTEKIPETDHKK